MKKLKKLFMAILIVLFASTDTAYLNWRFVWKW